MSAFVAQWLTRVARIAVTTRSSVQIRPKAIDEIVLAFSSVVLHHQSIEMYMISNVRCRLCFMSMPFAGVVFNFSSRYYYFYVNLRMTQQRRM